MILGATARAATITYSVGGWGPETYQLNSDWPGDTVAFQAFSGSLNLTPGVAAVGQINSLFWTVNYSAQPPEIGVGEFDFTASRAMTVSAGSGNVVQNGVLAVGADYDTLTVNGGSTVTFDLGNYTLAVTPLATGPWQEGSLGTTSYEVDATFLLNQVPDGGMTSMLLGMGMVGLGFVRRMVKKRWRLDKLTHLR